MPTYGSVSLDASVRIVQRGLAAGLPDARPVHGAPPIEFPVGASDAPRCQPAALVEGVGLQVHPIAGTAAGAVAAFLDGTQRSRVVAHVRGLPVVWATVAAVVRERRARRLTTWGSGPEVRRVLVAPGRHLSATEAAAIRDLADSLGAVAGDSSVDASGGDVAQHPLALLERARGLVEYQREGAEQSLAERWCASDTRTLFVDGGISGSERIAASPRIVGVIKSHRTLHVDGTGWATLCSLPSACRSSVFRVAPQRRTSVLSWYLRLRDATGRDPFWGLVRVEVAEQPEFDTMPELIVARADEVSRQVLAEVAPLALPDARWDRMVYGIRDCEEFLRAVV